MSSAAQIILAPDRPKIEHRVSIFLAGTTSKTDEPDWRETLIDAIKHLPVTIFNPKRDDWDSTWKEYFSDQRWAEQVKWEFDMQEDADVVVVFFHGVSPAPISLLELGLWVRDGKVIACAKDDYSKRGNVEEVCWRHSTPCVGTEVALRKTLIERLESIEQKESSQAMKIDPGAGMRFVTKVARMLGFTETHRHR